MLVKISFQFPSDHENTRLFLEDVSLLFSVLGEKANTTTSILKTSSLPDFHSAKATSLTASEQSCSLRRSAANLGGYEGETVIAHNSDLRTTCTSQGKSNGHWQRGAYEK